MNIPSGMLTLDQLRSMFEAGEIDTVLVAITDMQGRLQGKRCTARFFLDEVARHGTEGCNYLMAVDVEMNTVDGFAMSSWEHGYGDLLMRPDMNTLRRIPWYPATALVLCDAVWLDGSPVLASPRQILRRQLERLDDLGYDAYAATELEFQLFNNSYEDASRRGYRHLEASSQYNIDYSMIGTGRVESLLRDVRNGMAGAGMYVETAKGECNLGQHEIGFRYDTALTTCDNHSLYKTGAKEIAARHGKSISFADIAAIGYKAMHTSLAGMRATMIATWDYAVDLKARGAAAEMEFQARLKAHPMGSFHELAGFGKIKAMEEKYLPADEMQKYEGAVGL